MRFQIILAVFATYVASAMAESCDDCQRTCSSPSEAECSKLFATSTFGNDCKTDIYCLSYRLDLCSHLQRLRRLGASLYFGPAVAGHIFQGASSGYYFSGSKLQSIAQAASFKALHQSGLVWRSRLTIAMIQLRAQQCKPDSPLQTDHPT